jgi:hypothetical protein
VRLILKQYLIFFSF